MLPLRLNGQSEFETLSLPYKLVLPLMDSIAIYVKAKRLFFTKTLGREPLTNSLFVDGISRNSRRVKDGQAKWPALEATYNFSLGEGSNPVVKTIDSFWMNIRNAQAVRNRLIIAKKELRNAIMKCASNSDGRTVEIVSLAAGSAQAVIETIAELRNLSNQFGRVRIRALLIDNDETALAYARTLADSHGVSESVEIKEGNVIKFDHILNKLDRTPDIIEMMGLMDYLRNKLAIGLIKKIARVLPLNGAFLTCHIHPNSEAFFLRTVVNWDMIYRTVDEFKYLLVDGGFATSVLHTEPHNIHSVAVMYKSQSTS